MHGSLFFDCPHAMVMARAQWRVDVDKQKEDAGKAYRKTPSDF